MHDWVWEEGEGSVTQTWPVDLWYVGQGWYDRNRGGVGNGTALEHHSAVIVWRNQAKVLESNTQTHNK